MYFSETNQKVAAAFVKAWGEFTNPKHNAKVKVQTRSGGGYTFEYTDLGGILDSIKQHFKDNGLAVIQTPKTFEVDGRLYLSVETMFLHSSGEWIKSEPVTMLASQAIQDMGGQITYLKRYSLSAMLGISTEKDDDANGASGNSYEYEKKPSRTTKKATTSDVMALATPAIKGKYHTLYGSLDGLEEYLAKWGEEAGDQLAREIHEWREKQKNA